MNKFRASGMFRFGSLLLLMVALLPFESEGAKILFLLPISTRSETHFYRPMVEELSLRGHEVTLATSAKTVTRENVSEIITVDYAELFDFLANPFLLLESKVDMNFIFFDFDIISEFCEKVYQNAEFKEKIVNGQFDLVLLSPLLNQCFLGLVPKFNAKLILLSSLPQSNYILNSLGNYNPTSFVPHPCLPFTNVMSFYERLVNFLIDIQTHYGYYVERYYKVEAVYRKCLGDENIPGVRSIEDTASLILMNSHFTANYHRPNLPDVLEVGGLHCHPAEKVPEHLEEFLSEDFIYFSMGTCASGSTMPNATRRIFVNVFEKLNIRVLWKWETEYMEYLPSNIKLSKWIPQQDVLGHKNIKLFISHAGLLSTQETIYHAVPAILFPLFFDQKTNAKRAVGNGYAIQLDIFNLNENDLENAIKDILKNNERYKQKALEISAIYRDQPQTPLDRAIYWIEYVIRHNGAAHLRSASRDLNFIQYHSIDVVFVLLFIFILSLAVLLISMKKCMNYFFVKKENLSKKKN